MARRLLPLVVLTLLVAGPAAADNVGKKKQRVDAHLAQVQAQLARSKQEEARLSHQVGSLTTSIRQIELQVGGVSQRLDALQHDIALHQARLSKLDKLLRLQTHRYRVLRRQSRLSIQRLDQRLVTVYENPAPSTVDVLLAARSFQDVLDQLSYLKAMVDQDKQIALSVRTARNEASHARRHTASVRQTVRVETQVIRGRAQQVTILRAQLLTSQGRLASARGAKQHALTTTQQMIQQEVAESQSLASASAQLEAELQAEENSGSGSTTTSGGSGGHTGAPHFIWPVNGPITSPFGMRWGVLHPGIDIGVPTGTPVHASAAGKVIWCGWMSGYGNFVVIDHGGGYATAYGHNSKILVSCGQEVAQGQVVSLSGCTGFCTGPHVHFEVRVDGKPVDPLDYLG